MSVDVENVRTEFDPMIVPSGHVVHLVDWSFDWGHVVCGRSAGRMQETTVDDPRPTCRLCSGPAAIARAISFRKYHAERKAHDVERSKVDARMVKISVYGDLWREESRRKDLLAGITPEDRERLNLEDEANTLEATARMREENDALAAELGRRNTLRIVS